MHSYLDEAHKIQIPDGNSYVTNPSPPSQGSLVAHINCPANPQLTSKCIQDSESIWIGSKVNTVFFCPGKVQFVLFLDLKRKTVFFVPKFIQHCPKIKKKTSNPKLFTMSCNMKFLRSTTHSVSIICITFIFLQLSECFFTKNCLFVFSGKG